MSPWQPDTYLAAVRALLCAGDVRASGGTRDEVQELLPEVRAYALQSAHEQYRQLVAANIAPDKPRVAAAFDKNFVRLVEGLARATDQAQRRGHLEHSVLDFPEHARRAVVNQLLDDFVAVHRLVGLNVYALDQSPSLYQTASDVQQLMSEYSDLGDTIVARVTRGNRRNPAGALAQLRTAVHALVERHADTPFATRAIITDLALANPRDPNGAVEEFVTTTLRLHDAHPDIPMSIVVKIAYTYRDEPDRAMTRFLDRLADLTVDEPGIPLMERMWIAVKHPTTPATGVAAWRAGRLTVPTEAAGAAPLPLEAPASEVTR